MKKKKIIFVIPGFGESSENENYLTFKKDLEKYYDKVFILNLKWKHNTMTNYLKFVNGKIEKLKEDFEIDILGFSFGAMIAFILSKKFIFNKIILCSLSPYFQEHMPDLSARQIKFLRKRRKEDFLKYSYKEILNDIKLENKNIFMIYGEKEFLKLINLSLDISNLKKNFKIYKIENSGHFLFNPNYQRKIFEIL